MKLRSAAISISFFFSLAATAQNSPNIVLLLSDDQGWTGTSLQMDSRVANGGMGSVDRGTDELIWYYGAYRNMKHVGPQAAIRDGNYKLIRELDSAREYLLDLDLDLDLSETTDPGSFRQDVADRLSKRLDDYFAMVDLELPTRNTDYDPARDKGLISVMSVQ